MQNRLVRATGVAVVIGVSACAQIETIPRRAAHLTIDGNTHSTRSAACSQDQSYRTINIRESGGQVEAVVLFSGGRAIAQWVMIRNVDGFTGSFWAGGVGDARAEVANNTYTITGSASGISSSDPNKVVTAEFKITAEC
ncbi:lipoprotein LpqH [Mycobacterium haemophilum]